MDYSCGSSNESPHCKHKTQVQSSFPPREEINEIHELIYVYLEKIFTFISTVINYVFEIKIFM
jgi:hypothetical protein